MTGLRSLYPEFSVKRMLLFGFSKPAILLGYRARRDEANANYEMKSRIREVMEIIHPRINF